jgi:hypothetical protein
MTFRTLNEPVYCHAVSLSEIQNQAVFYTSELSVYDETGKAIEIKRLPIRDAEAPMGTRLLLFLCPPLQPNSGTYTLEVKDLAHDALKIAREGHTDELTFKPLRAIDVVDRIDLVVHYPKAVGELRMIAKDVEYKGQQMDPQELKQKYQRDYGFASVGWTGENIPAGLEFGADLVFAKK